MKAETKYFSYMISIFHDYFFWLLHIQLFCLFICYTIIFVSYFPFSFLLSCFPYNLFLYKAIWGNNLKLQAEPKRNIIRNYVELHIIS